MKIEWNKVTKFSQIIAVVLFVAVFLIAFQLGRNFEATFILGQPTTSLVKFICPDKTVINAQFYNRFVHLEFGWQKTLYLPQTMSADGGRYANKDESIVFWNKGDTAFVQVNGTTTLDNCVVKK